MPRFFVKMDDSDSEIEFSDNEDSNSSNNIFGFADDEEDDMSSELLSTSSKSASEKTCGNEVESEPSESVDRCQHFSGIKIEISSESVLKTLAEIFLSSPGKKKMKKLLELEKLVESNDLGLGMSVKMQYSIIAAIFDCGLEREYWNDLLVLTAELLNVLNSSLNVVLSERVLMERLDIGEVEEKPICGFYLIHGCVLSLVEKMDDEFNNFFVECDVSSSEYAQRLEDEPLVSEIIDKLQVYIERLNLPSEVCRLYMRKIDHLYHKFDPNCIAENRLQLLAQETGLQVMDHLCQFIYENDNSGRFGPRAILCQSYHLALHNEWNRAIDMLFTSILKEKQFRVDEEIQILYNRTMVQLGLCAFRIGHIREARWLLSQSSDRGAKLLGQDSPLPQTPLHLHLNLDLLECVYQVSSLLTDIPGGHACYQPTEPSSDDWINDSPESVKEYIESASKALKNGLWLHSVLYIINNDMNHKVWNLFHHANKIRTMLILKIKEQSLRIYLLKYSQIRDSISLEMLSELFCLELASVQFVIQRMICDEELEAFIDHLTRSVIIFRSNSTQLQYLSILLTGMQLP